MGSKIDTEADLMLRDGLVPAKDYADAVGRDLSSVYRAFDAGKIPGKIVGITTYKRRYVDVVSVMLRGDYAGSATITQKLTLLADKTPAKNRARLGARRG